MTQETVTPYPEPGGQTMTRGWSGSETSRERALAEDAKGTTASRQQQVVKYVNSHRYAGATVKEVRDHFGWHHGQASSALSVMHKAGDLERLTVTRDR